MNWIQRLECQKNDEKIQIKALKKIKTFTLYEHNSAVLFKDDQTFTCIFNCKKINNQHSIIGKIQGNLRTRHITISNSLTDHEFILGAKWQYQKIQLARFAFKYNQKSKNSILIKVNPVSGEVAVCLSFFIKGCLLEEVQHFRQMMTDSCQILGQESERIFNTIMLIIYQKQSNGPYLKSTKLLTNIPQQAKVENLLDKIKSLALTSSYYKLKIDTSSAHKNRSYFKKIFLTNEKEFLQDEDVQKLAVVYELKYNRIYERNDFQKHKQKHQPLIKDYIELQEKNQVEIARHLKQNQTYQQLSAVKISIVSAESPSASVDCHCQMKKIIKTNFNDRILVLIDNFSQGEKVHYLQILKKLKFSHPNISKYYFDEQFPQARITEGFYSLSLQEYLKKNKNTMSLYTKFDLMSQLCHAIQFMHKNHVGCFLRPSDILIDENMKIKVRNLSFTYAVSEKTGWRNLKLFQNDINQKFKLDIDYKHTKIQFPYINTLFNCQNDVENDLNSGLQNQKCDIFSLGMVLYTILIGKYPFNIHSIEKQIETIKIQNYSNLWRKIWTAQTQYYSSQGGQIVKLVAHLLLKCFNSLNLTYRPYVEWLTAIFSEIKTQLKHLY